MTQQRRDWLATFADPAALSDLFSAAKDCMGEVCQEHAAAECDCRDNLMTPLELAEWIEREAVMSQQRPTRFESGHRPRRKKSEQMSLAMAG